MPENNEEIVLDNSIFSADVSNEKAGVMDSDYDGGGSKIPSKDSEGTDNKEDKEDKENLEGDDNSNDDTASSSSEKEEGDEGESSNDSDKEGNEQSDSSEDGDSGEESNEDDGDDTDSSPSVINALKTTYDDIEFKDEEGNDIEFDNNIDGLKDLIDTISDKKAEKAKDNYISSNPKVREYALHLANGGDDTSFFKANQIPDYSKVEITDDSKETYMENVYATALRLKGLDQDEIQDAIELAKDKGVLKERASKSADALKDYTSKLKAAKAKEYDDLEKAEAVKRQEATKKVKSIINGKKLGNKELTNKEAASLEKFIFEADKEGVTEQAKAWESLTEEQALLLDFIVMNKFKGFGGVKEMKEDLDSLLKKRKDTLPKGGKKKTAKKQNEKTIEEQQKEIADIDIDAVMSPQ